MSPVDVVGNPIMKDDLIMIQRGDQNMLGIVQEIKEPSLLSAGKPNEMQMVGTVTVVLMPMTLPYNAQQFRLIDVVKVVKPPHFNKPAS